MEGEHDPRVDIHKMGKTREHSTNGSDYMKMAKVNYSSSTDSRYCDNKNTAFKQDN